MLFEAKYTMCLDCVHAIGGCSWSDSLTPVPGWQVEETVINNGRGAYAKSNMVINCPEFVWDSKDGGKKRMDVKLPVTELLAGLAEECAELAQAALKLRRAYDGTNPTPVSRDLCYERLLEEIADVELYLDQIAYNKTSVEKIKAQKLERWKKRLVKQE